MVTMSSPRFEMAGPGRTVLVGNTMIPVDNDGGLQFAILRKMPPTITIEAWGD